MSILKKAIDILEKYPLCNYCLGRQFSNIATGTTNFFRGKSIKTVLTMQNAETTTENSNEILRLLACSGSNIALKTLERNGYKTKIKKTCYLCKNTLDRIDELIPLILKIFEEFRVNTFLIGTILPNEWYEREHRLKKEYSINTTTHQTEFLKQEFNREIGKKIGMILNKKTDFNNPEIIIEIDPLKKNIQFHVRSIYIFGRYRKYQRNLPQTRWYCRKCKGKGCERCDFTGKQYLESVEELMGEEALKMFKGNNAVLHGSGREDIDVKMLGTGRPFVLEIKEPVIREVNLKKLEKRINTTAINKIDVQKLRYTNKNEVKYLKSHAQHATKKYEAYIEFSVEISDDAITHLENVFQNREIKQKTPERVKHRRANKIRRKTIYSVQCEKINHREINAEIICEGGTYIKELISGDNDRTKPSFSSEIGAIAKCKKLNVIEIREKPFSSLED